jgi:hypothetical protein
VTAAAAPATAVAAAADGDTGAGFTVLKHNSKQEDTKPETKHSSDQSRISIKFNNKTRETLTFQSACEVSCMLQQLRAATANSVQFSTAFANADAAALAAGICRGMER